MGFVMGVALGVALWLCVEGTLVVVAESWPPTTQVDGAKLVLTLFGICANLGLAGHLFQIIIQNGKR